MEKHQGTTYVIQEIACSWELFAEKHIRHRPSWSCQMKEVKENQTANDGLGCGDNML